MDKAQRKQIGKIIEGLKRQRDKHIHKIATMEGRKDTTHEYWMKEVNRFNSEIEDLERDLREE